MTNILICNRGLSALKFIISLKECSDLTDYTLFGFVSNADIMAQYKYATLLDQQIYVGDHDGIYTDMEAILAYCEKYEINMVFPGWGYLSESAEFVILLEQAGITFIGPTAAAMARVGNKISCNELAGQLDIPVLPWSGEVELRTYEELVYWCDRIGYPVMLKAGNSGGGKGIRIVNQPGEIRGRWQEIQAEVQNPMLYVTKYIARASHFEIQVVGDGETCIHLHGRDCSTQRRNQKLVEECPIRAVSPELVARMEGYAVRLLTHVKYRCLATVEFIYDQASEAIFILEVNPRIQVEHIITEQLFDLNLIRVQFLLALNYKLNQLPELTELSYSYTKHVVSIRINSENPYEDFRPILGKIDEITMTYSKNTWGYFSMDKGGEISTKVDSQFGHIMAWGSDRMDACYKLAHLIDRGKITGGIYNTTSFLKNYIISPDFQEFRHYTRYLHDIPVHTMINQRLPDGKLVFLTMVYLATLENAQRETACLDSITRGHSYLLKQYNTYTESLLVYKNILYRFKYLFRLKRANQISQQVLIAYGDQVYKVYFAYVQNDIVLFIENKMFKVQHGYKDAYALEMIVNQRKYNMRYKLKDAVVKSPVGGKIITCIFESGADILAGMEYIKIECMKMLMNFKAERSGKITYLKAAGETVHPNEPLVLIENAEGASEYLVDPQDTIQTLFAIYRVGPTAATEFIQYNLEFNVCNLALTDTTLPLNEQGIQDYPRYFSADFLALHRSTENVGLLAWQVNFAGGTFILLANNIQYRNGTFSYVEDRFFYTVLHYARCHGFPFVFLASNSGADININERVKFLVKPFKQDGEAYLYLTPEDYATVKTEVRAEFHPERNHYRVQGVNNDGLVNLDGSALLVAEMARARKEIATFTFVLGRTVGVGAYLAKLSERIIQRADSPIILTGYQALNNVLNGNLYESNLQLGGPQIMGLNGITQKVVDTTSEGMAYLREMLGYTLAKRIPAPVEGIPAVAIAEPIDAILDAETFLPTMADYAQTVQTGRARIGGRAFGVIWNTDDPVSKYVPCDPANLDTKVTMEKQSPCILYPDTSYKIAKTIRDANVEKLPLLILANWRGFSGGTRDMYNHVLDFGALMISELTDFAQSVYIYIPDGGQLRGGSMVVFSKSINHSITFCVGPTAHINVLEPNATKELKYKQRDVERYAGLNGITVAEADQVASLYTELNDVVNHEHAILNDPARGKVIDAVCSPAELRAFIIKRG